MCMQHNFITFCWGRQTFYSFHRSGKRNWFNAIFVCGSNDIYRLNNTYITYISVSFPSKDYFFFRCSKTSGWNGRLACQELVYISTHFMRSTARLNILERSSNGTKYSLVLDGLPTVSIWKENCPFVRWIFTLHSISSFPCSCLLFKNTVLKNLYCHANYPWTFL